MAGKKPKTNHSDGLEPKPIADIMAEAMHGVEERMKPHFAPVPYGFKPMASFTQAGIRVNRSDDFVTSAIQFAENMTPTIEEKPLLYDIGASYNETPGRRQWQKTDTDRPGVNLLEMKRLGEQLALGRGKSPSR